jgi:uncharacterized protein YkwD
MRPILLAIAFLPSVAFAAPAPDTLISLMNQERTAVGLSALRTDARLMNAAQEKAATIAARESLVHSSSAPGTPWPTLSRAGYVYSIAGENLAEGIPAAEDVVTDWMASASHRKNILTSGFTDVGAAVVTRRDTEYVVAYFAAPSREPVGKSDQTVIALLNQLIALYAELIRLMSTTSS